MDDFVTPSATLHFRDIDDWTLRYPSGCLPFRRLLSLHAKISFENACNFRWIEQKDFDAFQTFFDLSVGASDPDKNDSELSSISSSLNSLPPVGIAAAAAAASTNAHIVPNS